MLLGKKIGPFEVESELGSGAMGTVYKATYTKTGQTVALKVILQGLGNNKSMIARFEREVSVLKQLNHPNVVRILASGKYKQSPFYAMEFLDGEPLDQVIARRDQKKIPWEEVIALGTQLCAALHHAHEQGIIHRDLKPANIILTKDGKLKLTDFGIAKDLDVTQLTATNSTVGTASYMSPEQCKGQKHITRKSDLYALGVLLYEMLAGRHPFHAETLMEMFVQHTEGTFASVRTWESTVPVWLDDIVCQLLEKDPEDRPYDAERVTQGLLGVVEKVATGSSAAVDTVRGKRLGEETKTEREAKRTLFGRRKKKVVPVYQRVWFQAVCIVGLLGALAFLIYQGLKPGDPIKLHEEAAKLMASSNPEDWTRAREGPIEAYLAQKRGATDATTAQVQAWADRYDVDLRERQLPNRMRVMSDGETDVERIAWSAARKEETGDLEQARTTWIQLAKNKGDADADRRVWGLLGERRVKAVDEAEALLSRLNNEVILANGDPKRLSSKLEADPLVLDALRQEIARDPQATESWQKAKDSFKEKLDRDRTLRPWYLVASSRLKGVKPKK